MDYNNLEYLVNLSNWIIERVARQTKLIIDYNILSRSLSEGLKNVILATRGNTGVGKSYWIQQSLIEQMFQRCSEEYLQANDHLVHGVLNPDHVKAILKKLDNQPLLNSQVYLEGRVVFKRYLEKLIKHPSKVMGAVFDTRLLTVEEFREVLALSQLRGAKLEIIDVDASIWSSILSVLNREPFGKDPCVPFEVISDGYVRVRTNRREFIQAAINENVNYSLYRLAKDGQYVQVAIKNENETELTVKRQHSFNKCLEIPKEDKMKKIADTIITDELIESLVVPRNKEILNLWRGYSVKEALGMHSMKQLPYQSLCCSSD